MEIEERSQDEEDRPLETMNITLLLYRIHEQRVGEW